jgi:hypothetical protein
MKTMHRLFIRGSAVVLVAGFVVGGTAGASWAKAGKAKPTVTSALSSSSIPLGSTTNDTATVTGVAGDGAPTGSVTFAVCGPTASATPCTSPNGGSATVGLTTGKKHRSTATVTVEPNTTGWYCLLVTYSGDSHYKTASDNNAATECFDVTSGGGGGTHTPTIKSSLSPSSIPAGSTSVDTVTMTGNTTAGSPTGYITFYACGPTSGPVACTSPNVGPASVELSPESGNRSYASVTIQAGSPGWYCFLDEYSGDSYYKAVSDNDTSTECLDVTSGGGGGTYTPTIKSALSPSTVPYGESAVDTATVTGNATAGSPTGYVTFYACGPTASAAACTSPNVGPVSVELSPESGNKSYAAVTINPGGPGWYCFLDEYSGDSNYKAVSDNDPSTECLDVTGLAAAARHGAVVGRSSLTPASRPGTGAAVLTPASAVHDNTAKPTILTS